MHAKTAKIENGRGSPSTTTTIARQISHVALPATEKAMKKDTRSKKTAIVIDFLLGSRARASVERGERFISFHFDFSIFPSTVDTGPLEQELHHHPHSTTTMFLLVLLVLVARTLSIDAGQVLSNVWLGSCEAAHDWEWLQETGITEILSGVSRWCADRLVTRNLTCLSCTKS